MDKEQKKWLCEAWDKQGKIMAEIRDLAEASPTLAYGLIRSAETMIDMIFVHRAEKALKDTPLHKKP